MNTPNTARVFHGLAVNAGKVLSPACLYSAEHHRAVSEYRVETERDILAEMNQFRAAVGKCSLELDRIASNVAEKVGQTESEIFITQKHILNDPAIIEAIEVKIRQEHKNAEAAISEVFNSYEEKFTSFDRQYLRERATDIGEIRRRLLDYFRNTNPGFVCEGQEFCTRGKNRIIVAGELTVGMMANMNFERVKGFVTERGGSFSHAAVIARSLGVPAVSGIKGIMSRVACGDMLLLDGDNGMVYFDPDQKTVGSVISAEDVAGEEVCVIRTPEGMEAMANASLLEDVRLAASLGADGIGLFRTEILFLTADRLLSEEEQYQYYARILGQMENRPVTFRLLDVGGDKPLPFLKIRQESNPYLGWRGARFLLGSPEIFATQARALARLSRIGKVRVMFPMVIDARQQTALNEAFRDVLQTVDSAPENIMLGSMFEVPSACIQAREILGQVDFASIGSNDLVQYMFAVDRNNELVSQDYNPDHPVLWSVLQQLTTIAGEMKKPLSICGEMAAREGMPTRLLEIGLRSLSVSPRLIPRIRHEMAKYAKL